MAQQTPKEEAEELVLKMYQFLPAPKEYLYYNQYNAAKQCAKVALEKILSLVSDDLDLYYKDYIHYEQVKTELEKL